MNDFLWFEKQKCELFRSQIDLYQRGVVERLLQSFFDIEGEAKIEEERLLNSPVSGPDSDPGSFAEWVNDKVIQYYFNLKETRYMLFGFAVVGLYHLWERQIIGFLKWEIKHANAVPRNAVPRIERWDQIESNLKRYTITFKELPCHTSLNELRLVTNVIKHGEGKAKVDLEKLKPQLFELTQRDFSIPIGDAIFGPNLFLDRTDFNRYHQATIDFWDYEYWHSKGERCERV